MSKIKPETRFKNNHQAGPMVNNFSKGSYE